MNLLLEITKDTDICFKTPPPTEKVEAFAEERGKGPELKPMRLCLDVSISHAWNNDLAEQFVSWFMRYHDLEQSEEGLLHELFVNRFSCLKRRYNEWRLKEGEDTVLRTQRVKEKHQTARCLQRKDTRRNRVS
jgi:hypothetical protein